VNGVSLIKAELYNPATGTYSATGNMPSTRQEHTAALRPNGTVLVAGGNRVTLSTTTALASCAIYNPRPAPGRRRAAWSTHALTILRPYSITAIFWLQVATTPAANSAAQNSSDCRKQRAN
jgi:hypothetical protein